MQAYEFRSLTNAEIGQKLDEAYEELFNLRFQRASGQLKNTARKSELRREVARMKTVLRERQLAAWMAQEDK